MQINYAAAIASEWKKNSITNDFIKVKQSFQYRSILNIMAWYREKRSCLLFLPFDCNIWTCKLYSIGTFKQKQKTMPVVGLYLFNIIFETKINYVKLLIQKSLSNLTNFNF